MSLNIFSAYQIARELSSYTFGYEKFISVYASSDIKVYPFQMAAAMFALRSPYLKGVVLCDEGGLGKTVEVLLVISQKWYEGKRRIIIVVPNHLLKQWTDIIDEKFDIPFVSLYEKEHLNTLEHKNPFFKDSIILTTYNFAVENSEYVEEIDWDISVFEEAGRISKAYSDIGNEAEILKNAVNGSFKILVTPTPIEMSILDIYGLIYFIDENILPDKDWFYKIYFRKPENYSELTEKISRYCFRTLRSQAKEYMKLTNRIAVTIEYSLLPDEQYLYSQIEKYTSIPIKKAFPQMDQYELTLMLTKIASSSSFAISKTLEKIEKRLETMGNAVEELEQIRCAKETALSIKENAKGQELLFILKKLFPLIKRNGGNKKALIFTENRATQKYLFDLLSSNSHKALVYNGNKSKDFEIIKDFENSADILICTEVAATGLNLQFCSLVINYDWSYNALEIEQRINRCHRQDQNSDVIVINFLNPDNFSDLRILELMNKRMRQANGIVGMSDSIVGKYFKSDKAAVEYISNNIRKTKDIDNDFISTLADNKEKNKSIVSEMENSLFTTFDEKISNSVEISPQYIEDKINDINDKLWELTKYFFSKNRDFVLDDDTRTVRATGIPKNIFAGGQMRECYSMLDKTLPKAGRHTITGALARNIIQEIIWRGVPENGTLKIVGALPGEIAFYKIEAKPKDKMFGGKSYFTYAGISKNGEIWNDDECKKMLSLPVIDFAENKGENKISELDSLIDTNKYLNVAIKELESESYFAIGEVKTAAREGKAALTRQIEEIKLKVNSLSKKETSDKEEGIELFHKRNMLARKLKKQEQAILSEEKRIDAEAEKKIAEIMGKINVDVNVKREFLVKIK